MEAIFISYRRDDASAEARTLLENLRARFGHTNVLLDVAGLEKGRDFRKSIGDKLVNCKALIAVIGPSWISAADDAGQIRLHKSDDMVRYEIAAALQRDILVIPVLVHGATMPAVQHLPPDLRALAYRNGTELTHARWDSDVQELIRELQQTIAPESPSYPARLRIAAALAAVTIAIGGGAWYAFDTIGDAKRIAQVDTTQLEAPRPIEPTRVQKEHEQDNKRREQAERDREAREKAVKDDAERKATAEKDAAAKRAADKAQAERERETAAKASADRKATEKAERAEADRIARIEAERIAGIEADRIARIEADRIARIEADRIARIEADRIKLSPPTSPPSTLPRPTSSGLPIVDSAQIQAHNAGICITGYVWREARSSDKVCVTPNVRSNTTTENKLASSRRSPTGGAYGPETCKQGFVWRDAYPGDVVCVPPSSRQQAAKDNAQASRRIVPLP